MPEIDLTQSVKTATLEAVIIRADGRREPQGVIGRYERPGWLARIWSKLIGGKS